MSLPQMSFDREQAWWDAKASKEETDLADERINRLLRWREVEKHLDGMKTILDAGAATGAFSLPLAQRGFTVTHLDFSPAMLELARQKAATLHLEEIRFVQGNAVDLSAFPDQSFDLVLNMDGAISFCGSQAWQALRESCRVCRKTVIVSVSHRAQMSGVWLNSSLQVLGRLGQAAERMLKHGEWHQDQYAENARLTAGLTQNYMGALKAFLPCELRQALEAEGLRVLRCGGLGSLTNFVGGETLSKIMADEQMLQLFLDYCDYYDRVVLPDGPGTRQRAGLIAVGVRTK